MENPFAKKPKPEAAVERPQAALKRIEAGDLAAINGYQLGGDHQFMLEAIKLNPKAIEFGDIKGLRDDPDWIKAAIMALLEQPVELGAEVTAAAGFDQAKHHQMVETTQQDRVSAFAVYIPGEILSEPSVAKLLRTHGLDRLIPRLISEPGQSDQDGIERKAA